MKRLKGMRLPQSRTGFLILLVILFCIKTIIAYYLDFTLGVSDPLQWVILWINPIATTLFLLSFAMYIKRPWVSYITLLLIFTANTALLYFNVIYYRQFTDFLTINTIMGYDKVSAGLGKSTLSLFLPHDIIYWLDIPVLLFLLFHKNIKVDTRPYSNLKAFSLTSLSVALFGINLSVSEMNRPQLLTRTFDRNYIVKYLGIDAFTAYDAIKTARNSQVRAQANSSDMDNVLSFVKQHHAAANPKYYGVAKGKNVIIIHLESFQQFLIDDKVDGQEVTPFLNSLYHSKNTLAFSNFFHQVGQGKTSDAENMLETGVYGLPQGSVFSSLGSDNTFQGAPAILNQTAGYSSAVFHGNIGTFWNRNNVYKNLGYQYFFDSSYFDTSQGTTLEYGLKDKLLFAESTKYLEQLQQPFYAKFITVTNHYPFPLTKTDSTFPNVGTSDSAINGYFQTAHYLDQAVHEFFNYLKASGLYDNSIIILYGDHYGLSNSENTTLAPLLGKDPDTWTNFDNAQLQRVPYMIHMKGLKGGIQNQYGGEIDALPTLMHLLGIDDSNYIHFGTDLLSKQHDQVVAFRNNNFVTPKYTVLGDTVYDNATGKAITPDKMTQATLDKDQKKVDKELSLSDTVNNKNLLRFYTPAGFKPVNPSDYNYQDGYQKLVQLRKSLGNKSTSLYSKNGNKSTTKLYKTDAAELQGDKKSDITTVPSSSETDDADNSSSILSSSSSSSSTTDNNNN
ncbi:hypothetical protein IV38_GL000140 [Lactobacillus selangorensis]|uniref:Sulfatase N-terminal domain-containing protein n=1 Tax=Lactobacillus selangorensis TaxID=81857 RepID=A0A0R2FMN2_9LACO|nr:LTA synthase family protein [Lactobacillus selangorensis]KRN29258.1 hypothetical protein IV38_GL000140 [Lactobacillus selangorensis]KRN29784.1 hypothetical protein IV40_GL000585 [Lactobacillus selangorensis]